MKTVLLLLCFLWCITANSQEIKQWPEQKIQPGRSLGLAFGVNDFHLLDNYLSPYIFSNLLISPRVTFQWQAKRLLHRIELSYSYGHPVSKLQARDVTQNMGYLAYSLSKVVGVTRIAGQPLRQSLGAGVSSFTSSTDFVGVDKSYSYQWREQSWYCSNSFDLHFNSEYKTSGKNSFFLHVILPAFCLISRPENGHMYNAKNSKVILHFLNAELQGKPAFFWEQMAMHSEIGSKQPITSHCQLNLSYRFSYASSDRPLVLKMYGNQWMLGFDFLI